MKTPKLNEIFVIKEDGYPLDDAMALDDVTPEEARKEIERHGAQWNEFIREVGSKPKYTGKEVLGWLGY